MCACPPAIWPLVLIAALLVALGITGLLNTIATAIVAFIATAGAVALVAKVAWLLIENALERRSDRRWNARVAAFYQQRLPKPRQHVDIRVVEGEQPAIEGARTALPAGVRIHATPVQELTKGAAK